MTRRLLKPVFTSGTEIHRAALVAASQQAALRQWPRGRLQLPECYSDLFYFQGKLIIRV